jgi:hypothetical protein
VRSEPGPSPMTLGGAAAACVRLIVWCRECGHQVEPDPGEMAARYGAERSTWSPPGPSVKAIAASRAARAHQISLAFDDALAAHFADGLIRRRTAPPARGKRGPTDVVLSYISWISSSASDTRCGETGGWLRSAAPCGSASGQCGPGLPADVRSRPACCANSSGCSTHMQLPAASLLQRPPARLRNALDPALKISATLTGGDRPALLAGSGGPRRNGGERILPALPR